MYHMLLSPSPLFSVKAPAGTNLAGALAVVGAVLVILGRTGDGEALGPFRRLWPRPSTKRSRPNLSRLGLVVGVVSLAAIAFTFAQHLSGGGSAYARYLFPVLPLLATVASIGYDRILPRLAIAALGVGVAERSDLGRSSGGHPSPRPRATDA